MSLPCLLFFFFAFVLFSPFFFFFSFFTFDGNSKHERGSFLRCFFLLVFFRCFIFLVLFCFWFFFVVFFVFSFSVFFRSFLKNATELARTATRTIPQKDIHIYLPPLPLPPPPKRTLSFTRPSEYDDRLQFQAFVCDKASASGGLNKFHNTLHFDPGE